MINELATRRPKNSFVSERAVYRRPIISSLWGNEIPKSSANYLVESLITGSNERDGSEGSSSLPPTWSDGRGCRVRAESKPMQRLSVGVPVCSRFNEVRWINRREQTRTNTNKHPRARNKHIRHPLRWKKGQHNPQD